MKLIVILYIDISNNKIKYDNNFVTSVNDSQYMLKRIH